MKLSTTLRSLMAITAGIDWTWNAAGDPWVLVDVHLDELDSPAGRVDDVFEYRPERAARTAPRSPEVDHHRHLFGPVEDRLLEIGVTHV